MVVRKKRDYPRLLAAAALSGPGAQRIIPALARNDGIAVATPATNELRRLVQKNPDDTTMAASQATNL
jgi:hypothetical protein